MFDGGHVATGIGDGGQPACVVVAETVLFDTIPERQSSHMAATLETVDLATLVGGHQGDLAVVLRQHPGQFVDGRVALVVIVITGHIQGAIGTDVHTRRAVIVVEGPW